MTSPSLSACCHAEPVAADAAGSGVPADEPRGWQDPQPLRFLADSPCQLLRAFSPRRSSAGVIRVCYPFFGCPSAGFSFPVGWSAWAAADSLGTTAAAHWPSPEIASTSSLWPPRFFRIARRANMLAVNTSSAVAVRWAAM
jgi:hypothetical protein